MVQLRHPVSQLLQNSPHHHRGRLRNNIGSRVPSKDDAKKDQRVGAVNINNYNTANSSSNNSNKVDVDTGSMEVDPLYLALHGPAAAKQDEEEVLQAEEENEEVKIWKILKKAAHLRLSLIHI